MSLVIPANFQHILRVMNTNIDGKLIYGYFLAYIAKFVTPPVSTMSPFLVLQAKETSCLPSQPSKVLADGMPILFLRR